MQNVMCQLIDIKQNKQDNGHFDEYPENLVKYTPRAL